MSTQNDSKSTDILTDLFGMEFIDTFHGYVDPLADNRFYHMLKARNCRDFIKANASPTKTFLDAGAGRGPYTRMAQGAYAQIYSFEYEPNELRLAQENVGIDPTITFKQVDITNIPLDDASVDTAVCSEVLEHIPDNRKAMSELYRVMKPGGTLLFSMPNNNSLLYAPSRFKNRKTLRDLEDWPDKNGRWEQLRHYTFSYKNIEDIATKAGFTIIKRRGAHAFRLPSTVRRFLMKNIPPLFKLYFMINIFLEKHAARFGSFYFLTLRK